MALPYNELYNFVYSYLDQFTEAHLKDLIWASLTNGLWTMRDLVEDAMLMMENDWDSYPEGYLSKGDTVDIGDLEYENWPKEDE